MGAPLQASPAKYRLLLDRQSLELQQQPHREAAWQGVATLPMTADQLEASWAKLRAVLPQQCRLTLLVQKDVAVVQHSSGPKLKAKEWAPFIQQKFARQLQAGDVIARGCRTLFAGKTRAGRADTAHDHNQLWLLQELGNYLPLLVARLQGHGHALAQMALHDTPTTPLWSPEIDGWQRLSRALPLWRGLKWGIGGASMAGVLLLLFQLWNLRSATDQLRAKLGQQQQLYASLLAKLPMSAETALHWQTADLWWQSISAANPPLSGWLAGLSQVWPAGVEASQLNWQAGRSKPADWWMPSPASTVVGMTGSTKGHPSKEQPGNDRLTLQFAPSVSESPEFASLMLTLPEKLATTLATPAVQVGWQMGGDAAAAQTGQVLILENAPASSAVTTKAGVQP
jgi:hypothetical protein